MEVLIVLIWLLLAIAVPVFIIISSYVGYKSSESRPGIIAVAVTGIILHLALVAFSFFPVMFILVMGAHTEPLGETLGWPERFVLLGIEVLYGILAISSCSFLSGRRRPWPLSEKNL